MKLRIDAEIPDRWVPVFLGFLERLRLCGSVGMSRVTSFFADGDGDFRIKFDVTSDSEIPKPAGPVEDFNGTQLFDAG